jgi:HK97 gp10 family phage protein
MIKPTLSIAGFKALEADFKLLSKTEQRKVSKKAVRAGAVVFRDAIRASAPVRTGRLRRSISVDTARSSLTAGVKFKKIRVTKKSKKGKHKNILPFYWWMIENGTSKMSARPFVRPAFDANVKKAEDAAFEQFLKDIDEIFLK